MTTEHKGLPVRKHSAAVRGASGDALNGALKVAPQDFVQGVPAYMILEVDPNGETFKPMDDNEAWEEIQIVRVKRGAFVDAATALPFLDDVSSQLEDLRVSETGQEQLGDQVLTLEADHVAGLHRRARNGCPLCHPKTDEDHARADELAAKRAERAEHVNGEGDADNPLPPARKRRSRAKGATKSVAKKAPAKRVRKSTAKK